MLSLSALILETLAFRAIDRGDAIAARRYLEAATDAHIRDATLMAWREARTATEKRQVLARYFSLP